MSGNKSSAVSDARRMLSGFDNQLLAMRTEFDPEFKDLKAQQYADRALQYSQQALELFQEAEHHFQKNKPYSLDEEWEKAVENCETMDSHLLDVMTVIMGSGILSKFREVMGPRLESMLGH